MFQFAMGLQANIQYMFDHSECVLCLSYILNCIILMFLSNRVLKQCFYILLFTRTETNKIPFIMLQQQYITENVLGKSFNSE